ncbi:MAG: hypothetical protein FJ303_09460 [Planctomycetes bacterium]|nr:hypothetical protein [Planctomycetota bacterium]
MIEAMQAPEQLRACFARLRAGACRLAALPLDALLGRLGRLCSVWQAGSPARQHAAKLIGGVFGAYTVEAALNALAMSLHAPILKAELARELGRADLLDSWQPDELGIGWTRGYPLGVVAQVLAGNVFLGGVIALAQALLTRNAVVIKLSSEDSGFTELFAKTLLDADDDGVLRSSIAICSWSSAQDALNQVLREEADAIVVWGGQAAVDAYPADRCRGRVIHYGPRLGIGFVLDGADLAQTARDLAWDVALWEQRACSSPRVVFVEDVADLPAHVASALSKALTDVRNRLPARPLTLDDKAEVTAIRELAYWQEHATILAGPRSMDHTVLVVDRAPAEIPLGYRTVCVIPFRGLENINELAGAYRSGLQTVVLAAPSSRWANAAELLAQAGFTQIAAAGSAAARFLGLPHEGEYALRRLIRLVGVDLGAGPLVEPDRKVPDVRLK